MCGIGGICNWPSDPERALSRLGKALSHRGPDGSGTFSDSGISLVHERLAIIDIAGGRQPLYSEDENLVLVCNGEIYNFAPLREELERKGHVFSTRSDSEVILHLWEEEGEGAISRLNGMFAFAIYHRRERKLWLVRDRAGVKPLYFFAGQGGSFAFASELPALTDIPEIRSQIEIDPQALWHFLSLLYVPAPLTAFKNIQALQPGHFLRWSAGSWQELVYWTPPGLVERPYESIAEAAEILDGLVSKSVRSQLVSDVSLGAYLSGGVDSSLVVAAMSEQSPSPVKTFTIQIQDPDYDETGFADRIARQFKTDHTVTSLAGMNLDMMADLQAHIGQPFADPSMVPTFLISRAIRESVVVALGGDGPDELLAGYDKYKPLAGRATCELQANELANLFFRVPDELKNMLCTSNFANGCQPTLDYLAGLLRVEASSAVQRLRQFDFRFFLEGDILAKIDRMSMRHALEARVPLLDNDIIDFSLSLPDAFLIDRQGQGKAVLKEVLAGKTSHDFAYRQKIGFTLPTGPWLRAQKNHALERLSAPKSALMGELTSASGRAKLSGLFLQGYPKAENLLLAYLMLDDWLARL